MLEKYKLLFLTNIDYTSRKRSVGKFEGILLLFFFRKSFFEFVRALRSDIMLKELFVNDFTKGRRIFLL